MNNVSLPLAPPLSLVLSLSLCVCMYVITLTVSNNYVQSIRECDDRCVLKIVHKIVVPPISIIKCKTVYSNLIFLYFYFVYVTAAKWAKFQALDIRTWLPLKSVVNIWRIHFWGVQFTETFHHSIKRSLCVRCFVW